MRKAFPSCYLVESLMFQVARQCLHPDLTCHQSQSCSTDGLRKAAAVSLEYDMHPDSLSFLTLGGWH